MAERLRSGTGVWSQGARRKILIQTLGPVRQLAGPSAFAGLHDPAYAVSTDDFTDQPRGMLRPPNLAQHGIQGLRRNRDGHADAHVEYLVELGIRHAAPSLNHLEQRMH